MSSLECLTAPLSFVVYALVVNVVCSLIYSKHVKDLGLGLFLVQEHGQSKYGNRVKIEIPDAEGQGGRMECTCNVPSRYRLPCQDVMAALSCEPSAGRRPGVGFRQYLLCDVFDACAVDISIDFLCV